MIKKVSNEFDWATIPTLPIDKVLWTEDCGIRGTGQLCYNDEYFDIRTARNCVLIGIIFHGIQLN